MDKFIIFIFWIYSLLGVTLLAHDFGYEEGSRLQRIADNDKLQNCHRVITRIAE